MSLLKWVKGNVSDVEIYIVYRHIPYNTDSIEESFQSACTPSSNLIFHLAAYVGRDIA